MLNKFVDFLMFLVPFLCSIIIGMCLIVAVLWLAEKFADWCEAAWRWINQPKRSKY